MALTIINAELVRELLPMADCIDVMAQAMVAASTGTVSIPPRLLTPLIDNSGLFIFMPGSSEEIESYGAKVLSAHPANPAKGLPLIQGFVILFEHNSGAAVAIVEGAEITAIRTAAASGLATRLLAREDASSCGIFGTGVQAITHIDAMRAVRPVQAVLVWGRDFARTRVFANQQSERTGLNVRACKEPAEVGACELICTVTGSSEPVLLGSWVQAGAHVNLVGSHTLVTREADTDLIVKSAVYVDLMASVRNEGGDVMIPVQEGAVGEDHIIGEIGSLLLGDIPGRVDDSQITLYNSLGIAAQDLFAAQHVYQLAQSKGLGVSVDF